MEPRYRKEIERLYLQMHPMLLEYARSHLANDALAEEAVQDTFTIACQKPEDLYTSQRPEGWLVLVLKHVISNTLRTQSTAKRILEQYCALHADEIAVAGDRVEPELLYGDMACLEEFRLLQELAIEGRSYLEMAQKRGISVAACRKRVQRAKETLRKKMEI